MTLGYHDVATASVSLSLLLFTIHEDHSVNQTAGNGPALLEKVQRRATKYISNKFTSDYKLRLLNLNLLPLIHPWSEND